MSTPVGRKLVNLYHTCTPAVAGIIADHPSLRFSARVVFMPMVGLSYLASNLGPINTLLFMLVLVSGLICIAIFRKKFGKN